MTFILEVDDFNGLQSRGNRGRDVFHELLGTIIKTNHWPRRVMQSLIHMEHVFHVADERGAGAGQNTHALDAMIEIRFLSVTSTVSSLISSTVFRSTN